MCSSRLRFKLGTFRNNSDINVAHLSEVICHHRLYLMKGCLNGAFSSRLWALPEPAILCTQLSGFSRTARRRNCHSSTQAREISMEQIKTEAVLHSETQSKVALKESDKTHTYKQLIDLAWKFSTLLQGSYKKSSEAASLLSNARIGIIAKPSAEFVAGLWATWICGAVAVPLAVSYPEEELLHVMNDADVSIVLGMEGYQELLEKVAKKCSARYFLLSSALNKNSEKGGESNVSREGPRTTWLTEVDKTATDKGGDPALFIYTSGTTGKPKGAVHTHNSITSQVKMLAEAWKYTPDDTFLHCLPLHHVHGLFNALLAPLYAGSTVDLMPKFSVRGVWQKFRDSYGKGGASCKNAITVFTGVPTMYARLLQGFDGMDHGDQEVSAASTRKLRLMMCGSSALPFPVMKRWESITGHRLLERYGMTEFGMALSNPLDGTRKEGTVGRPLPGVQVKVLGDNANSSNEGELCVKSPSMFREYWKQPQVTKDSFGDDGYFRTGDTVKMDADGYYVILGRTNVDILKVGGYKLSALEIEGVLLGHPKISECAILGLPDEDYGEIICAVIVLEKEAGDSDPLVKLQNLQNWAKDKLAPYKIPQRLHVWESLPRNAMGKVNKKELKQLLLKQN